MQSSPLSLSLSLSLTPSLPPSPHSAQVYVRLVNTNFTGPGSQYEGRVEVYDGNQWGTVCDNGWDWEDAHVVCVMSGFGTAVRPVLDGYYGRGEEEGKWGERCKNMCPTLSASLLSSCSLLSLPISPLSSFPPFFLLPSPSSLSSSSLPILP